MQIKVASMFQVVETKGEKMSHGETVTVLNDMCFMARSTLISKNIQRETIDSLSVRAKFTNDKITVPAVLKFTQQGELINFISEDRYYCEDGKTYLSYNGQLLSKIILISRAARFLLMEKQSGIYLMKENSAMPGSI